MVNIDDFIKRLEIILDYYNLSASAFADKINVQRSSLSHLLSGRNKPSLDFIIKVIEVFPELDLYWILNGKGTFPTSEKNFSIQSTKQEVTSDETNTSDLFSTDHTNSKQPFINNEVEKKSISLSNSEVKTIERIVIFYTDGSFKNYQS
ncbi:helix-turn-helix domain-containing protein [Flavobacterium sp.]|jgi:transcriptional regulator with XRE-family HTH domain|uniref:helix-turn-helix domain-containing protein n=1 Tax=Flavobacterium sp. TaxID=239 RepID=UPI0037C01CAE